jgi:hypothetical protein
MPGVVVSDQGAALADDDARPQPAAAPDPAQPDSMVPARAPAFDPDAAELEAARAELAAAEAEANGGPAAQNDSQQEPAAPPPPAPTGRQQQRPKAVPYDRFAQQSRELQIARERNIYLEGALAAVRQGGNAATDTQQQSPAQPAASAPTDPIVGQIQQQRQLVQEAARRFDVGEITLVEFEAVRGQVEDQIADLRAQQRQNAPSDSLADQAIERAHMGRLLGAHPYAANLTTEQAQWLADFATMELAGEGNPIRDGSKAETLRLRERVALLSDRYGPMWGVQPSGSSPAATTSRQQVPTQQTPGLSLSPAAQARQAKMGLAASLPPDPARFGMGAPSEISAEQIATMDDEAIAALPPAVRNRVLQSTA